MTHVACGWAFLVARGRHVGHRTLLAPGFLVDENLHHVLAESTGISEGGAAGTGLVELDNAHIGAISIGYTSERLARADVEQEGPDGGELLTDEHGRPLEVVYGVVSRDRLEEPLDTNDLRTARAQALRSYRRFLADEQGHPVETSVGFALRTSSRARTGSASTSAAADEHVPDGGVGTDEQRPRRWRPGRGAASAILLAIALAAVGVVLLLVWPEPSVTVYSSLPLQGSEGTRSEDVIRGMRLALKQAGSKAGKVDVKYVPLDNSTAKARGWAQEAVAANALRAARDDSTAVYIGESNSGASAVSIPILSGAKVPQISPSNTAVGLTTSEAGAADGEPDTYYVGGFRNYVRIVPRDTIQGAALATVMQDDGCKHAAIIHDSDLYGAGLARIIRRSMTRQRLRRVLDEPLESTSPTYLRALARRTAHQKADCVVFSGITTNGAVRTFEEVAHALPAARLYGSDGVANRAFTDVNRGGLPENIAARVKLTVAALGPEGFGTAGRRFFAQFAEEYPANTNPDLYAIYGYEAMSLALDAIKRAGSTNREDIVKALFDTKDRRSAIGTYSIDNNGDTTLTDYGLFKVQDGAPIFERKIVVPGS